MTEEVLAQIIGLSLFIFSFILLYDKKILAVFLRLLKSKEFLVISGFCFSFIGIVIISIHNSWTLSWQGVLTLTGWLFLIEGLFRLLFMDVTSKMIKEMNSITPIKVSLLITMTLGAFLTISTFL